MSSEKFQFVAIAVLGAACIALIVWFLLSESSPVMDVDTGDVYALVTSNDVPVEVRKSETSYWAEFNTSDTLKAGDVIRSTESGLVYLNVSEIGYIELVAPFELKLNPGSNRLPAEWLLTSGRMRYFYSFDSLDIPNTVATSEGKFIFSSIDDSETPTREIVVSNTENEIQFKVLSGSGSWVEDKQSAIISSNELLKRDKSNGELFKSTIHVAPSALNTTINGSNVEIKWQTSSAQDLYIVRVFKVSDDTLRHYSTLSTNGSSTAFQLDETGVFLFQVS
jgi:hypothetical protein